MKILEYQAEEALKLKGPFSSALICQIKKLRWAGARLCFIGFLSFGVTTGVGLYLLAPLFSYYFFGTLRFWKYAHMGPRLIAYAYTMAFGYLKREFTPSVRLTAPPMTKPDPVPGYDPPRMGKRRILRRLRQMLQEDPLPPSGRDP